jgi:hypothetical protein
MAFIIVYIIAGLVWMGSAAVGLLFSATVSAWVAGFAFGGLVAAVGLEYRVAKLLGEEDNLKNLKKSTMVVLKTSKPSSLFGRMG